MAETNIKRNISTQATHSLPLGLELNIIPITVLGSHTAHPTLPNDHWQWQKQILQILPLMLTAHSPRQYTHASILFISLPRKRFYEDKLSCEKFKRQFLLHFYTYLTDWGYGINIDNKYPGGSKNWDHVRVRRKVKHNWTLLRYLAQ